MFDLDTYIDRTFERCVRSKEDLHDYQREALNFLRNHPFSALFIDVGMGKTITVLTLLDEYFTRGFEGKVLITAPIRVANRVWMQEHKLWTHTAYLRPTLLRIDDDDPRLAGLKGMSRKFRKLTLRKEALEDDARIHVINVEAIPWLVDQWYERGRWPYQIVIYDEASRLRDHKAEGVKALRRVRSKIKRLHELTATPASQSYMHFFSQMYLLDEGKRLGTRITPFRERYFDHNRYTHVYKLREGADREIEGKIADIALVMRRSKNFKVVTRHIDLPKDTVERYGEFERDLLLQLPNDVVIDAVNGAVLCGKLLQFASGQVYDETRTVHTIHDEKIEELRQFLTETDEPVICAYWFKSSLSRLQREFPFGITMGREGKEEVNWNKRKIRLLFVHPQSAGHGLNMQFGGHHLVIYDLFYSLELFLQLIGRLDRQGQVATVLVHMLSARGTIDEIVSGKLAQLEAAENAMFRRLQNLRKKLK